MSLVTITSDIGQHDFVVGAIKGQLLQINPGFIFIDISHQLSPFNYPQAAYVCRNALKNFPAGTLHLVLVNMFEQKPTHLLLARHNDHYIGCADNGLLTMILEELPQEVIALPLEKSVVKNVLYCAQIFGKAFQSLLKGAAFHTLGDAMAFIQVKNALRPMQGGNWIEGQIIFIDNFENVIVNISRADFESQRRGRSFKIIFKRDETIERISETYADVADGEKLAIFNSAGYLEIAINKGNAAGLLGLQGFSESQQQGNGQYANSRLFYQTVKIFFD